MRDRICAALAALAISAAGLDSAFGSCLEFPFEDQMKSADIIFVGTLRAADAAWTADRKTIVTRYRFGHVRYIKGAGPKSDLILVQEGGRVGNKEIIPNLRIEFREGRRYVVFASIGRAARSLRTRLSALQQVVLASTRCARSSVG